MAEQIRRISCWPRDAGHFAMAVSVTLVSLFGLIIRSPANDAISALDTDKDGTVDIEEAETAASQIFYLVTETRMARSISMSSRDAWMPRRSRTATGTMMAHSTTMSTPRQSQFSSKQLISMGTASSIPKS